MSRGKFLEIKISLDAVNDTGYDRQQTERKTVEHFSFVLWDSYMQTNEVITEARHLWTGQRKSLMYKVL